MTRELCKHAPWPDGVCDLCASYRTLFRMLHPPKDLFEPPARFLQVAGFWVDTDEGEDCAMRPALPADAPRPRPAP
jgi:hypothetical protein